MSPMSLRAMRCRITSESTLPRGPLLSLPPRAAALEPAHDLARARDHGFRQAGEARDVDPVALARATGHDAAEQHDLAGVLAHEHGHVAHARARVRERDELVVMRGEQRAAAD